MKTIIVPLDGSDLAEQALPLASTVAKSLDAEVVLTTAISVGDRWVDDGFIRQFEEDVSSAVKAYLAEIAGKMRQRGVSARIVAEWGRPYTVITNSAEQEEADLIIMTTHGRSGFERFTLGSVADKVLHTTKAPLMLIRPADESQVPETFTRIAVPLDGSKLAEAALVEAEHLARAMDASLLLVRAVAPSTTLYADELIPGDLPVLNDIEEESRHYLEERAQLLRKHEFAVDVATGVGVPADVILTLAEEAGADLVLMTSHGRTGLNRLVLGSVADEIVHRGDIPVMLIRPAKATDKEEAVKGVPVAVNTVVPPPAMTETGLAAADASPLSGNARGHRPERSPGR